MYERNAIIIERYFDKLFGYNLINNIKVNFSNYCGLIDASERYKEVSEEEEEIIIEYDIIANKIREIQKKQENLNKRNIQFQQERNELFQNIDEDANLIQKKLDGVYIPEMQVEPERDESILSSEFILEFVVLYIDSINSENTLVLILDKSVIFLSNNFFWTFFGKCSFK